MKKIRNIFARFRKYTVPALLIALLALFAAAAVFRPAPDSGSFPETDSASGEEPDFSPESIPTSAPARAASAPDWLLLEHSGHAVVYNGENLAFITDIDLNTLRAADRELLRLGIGAEDLDSILMLIEDPGS